MKKAMIVFAVIALVVAAASPAAAYYGMGGPRQGGACVSGPADMARDINLTAEQTEKMNTLREAHWKEIKPIKDQIYSKRGDLRILWLAKEPDKEKILNLQKDIQNLRGQLMEKATNHRLEMRKILTPEQLAKAQSDRGMGWHSGRDGAGMRGGQPPLGPPCSARAVEQAWTLPAAGLACEAVNNHAGQACSARAVEQAWTVPAAGLACEAVNPHAGQACSARAVGPA